MRQEKPASEEITVPLYMKAMLFSIKHHSHVQIYNSQTWGVLQMRIIHRHENCVDFLHKVTVIGEPNVDFRMTKTGLQSLRIKCVSLLFILLITLANKNLILTIG